MTERLRAPNSNSGVSNQQSVGSNQIGRKAVGPVCCVTHVKEPCACYRKEKGAASVFLAVAAECAVAPCKLL